MGVTSSERIAAPDSESKISMLTHARAAGNRSGPWFWAGLPSLASNSRVCMGVLLACDALACAAAFIGALLLAAWYAPMLRDVLPERGVDAFAGVDFGLLACFATLSHYHRRIPFWTELQHIVIGSLAALACSGFVVFLGHEQISRVLLVSSWLLLPPMIVLLRRIARLVLARIGIWQIRVLVVGGADTARRTVNALQSEPGLGYDIARTVTLADVCSPGAQPSWRAILNQYRAQLVVLAVDREHPPGQTTVGSLLRQRVPFAMVPETGALPVLGFQATRFFSHDTVMFQYRNNLAQPMARLIKTAFDLVAASALIIVLSPLLLLIAAAVSLDGGPVLFSHTRLGIGGRSFRCFKFRTMVVDSAGVLQRMLASDPAAASEWAMTQKLRHDPRITRVGAFLRKTSLDELPQLLNVLRLEMSLVGPRPIVSAELPRYGEDIAYYFEARPGLTGLWQVSGRAATTYAARVQFDTWYVKNWTIWHDVAILAKTIPAVLKRKGAY